jgi:CheY-like chemotaxis protein/two-component sensor histidine kinase
MALLLDDLLDVSRITQGRLTLKMESVSLESIVEAAVETARPLIDEKKHSLKIDLPAKPVMLAVDPLRLSQSLSNLLTNSAKYTDEGGQITLSVTVSPEELVMAVADTGIGIEANALPGLFEMFSQVNSAIARSEGGLGIGLALVKGLVELHEGTIEAHSTGLGLGSRFTIHLPRPRVLDGFPQQESEPPSTRLMGSQRHKILVADDNKDAADSLGMILEMSGYLVSVCHNGEQALALAAKLLPRAMILDIGMPDITGYEVARRVRAESWGRDIYLIAVTGWGQSEDKARASDAGFNYHLTKPVDPDRVEELLRAFFKSRPNLFERHSH